MIVEYFYQHYSLFARVNSAKGEKEGEKEE